MSRSPVKTPKRRKHWRDVPDSISCLHGRPWHRARSLAPTIETILAYVNGDETAVAIIDSWRPHFTITEEP